jgi:uncharacterized protein (TIGR02246 family)
VKYRARVITGCLLAVLAGTSHSQTIQTKAADEHAIRNLIAAHASASQQDDFAGLVAGYHDDADLRLSDGSIVSGKAAIEKRYRDILSGGARQMAHVHPPETIRIRFLRPEVAFVDVESVPASGSGSRTPYFLVFTKVHDKWGVAVERNGVPLK